MSGNQTLFYTRSKREERINVDLSGINMVEMHVQPNYGTMFVRHNISSAWLLILIGVDTIETMMTKLTMETV